MGLLCFIQRQRLLFRKEPEASVAAFTTLGAISLPAHTSFFHLEIAHRNSLKEESNFMRGLEPFGTFRWFPDLSDRLQGYYWSEDDSSGTSVLSG